MRPTISLAMIVRDEAEHLAACLESARRYVDEIVVVDTGSTDRTVEIAQNFTAHIFHLPWPGDFSAARNFAKSKCSGDWILSLDADEQLDCGAGTLWELLERDSGHEFFFLPLDCQGMGCVAAQERFAVLRFFRNKPEYSFAGSIHEQVMIPNAAAVGWSEAPAIIHAAIPQQRRNAKRRRNVSMLKQAVAAAPDNGFLHYYLGVEWLGFKRYDKALPFFQQAVAVLGDENILFRAPALRHLIACLAATGKVEEALGICMEESANYPLYADLFFDGGVLLQNLGEYAAAVKWFQAAMECGMPPPFFSHTHGTESYLALYHLGYCHEKLNRHGQAEAFYRQALTLEPDYVYPLFNLFLLQLANLPVGELYRHFQDGGYLERPSWRTAIAELFLQSGYPVLAAACLEAAEKADAGQKRLWLKALIYSGRPEAALGAIKQHPAAMPDGDAVVALLLASDQRAAKLRALELWRKPDKRGAALALLALVSHEAGGPERYLPEKGRRAQFTQTILGVVADCLRGQGDRRYLQLAQKGLELLAAVPDSGEAVAAFWQGEQGRVLTLVNQRNALAGRLYL